MARGRHHHSPGHARPEIHRRLLPRLSRRPQQRPRGQALDLRQLGRPSIGRAVRLGRLPPPAPRLQVAGNAPPAASRMAAGRSSSTPSPRVFPVAAAARATLIPSACNSAKTAPSPTRSSAARHTRPAFQRDEGDRRRRPPLHPRPPRRRDQSGEGRHRAHHPPSSTTTTSTATIDYHGGDRYPHLTRDDAKPDYLDELIKPRAGGQ